MFIYLLIIYWYVYLFGLREPLVLDYIIMYTMLLCLNYKNGYQKILVLRRLISWRQDPGITNWNIGH
mgnify:CR=1 FL=1